MKPFILSACSLMLLSMVSCVSGHLDSPVADTGCCDGGPDGSVDLCAEVTCPRGQRCVDGFCHEEDLCVDVTCPNVGEVCDPRSGLCVAGGVDADNDGVTIAEGDCDDGDAGVYPGAVEVCDGRDQNCDLVVDDGFDIDGDGVTTCGGDCNDNESRIRPGAVEVCDGVDNDCNGSVDEGLDPKPCTTACGTGTEQCEGGLWVCSVPSACDCLPGETGSQGCGNCGSQSRSCLDSYTWSAWSSCAGQGVCSPGSMTGCSMCSQTGTQTCTGSCSWGSCVVSGCCSDGECGAAQRCFSGYCSDFCHRTDGTQTCRTVCGWAGMTCRGAIIYDTGERSNCDVEDVRMDCYGT